LGQNKGSGGGTFRRERLLTYILLQKKGALEDKREKGKGRGKGSKELPKGKGTPF